MIANLKYCSYFPSEGEVLLGPGLIYEIAESKKDNDVYRINLKALTFKAYCKDIGCNLESVFCR